MQWVRVSDRYRRPHSSRCLCCLLQTDTRGPCFPAAYQTRYRRLSCRQVEPLRRVERVLQLRVKKCPTYAAVAFITSLLKRNDVLDLRVTTCQQKKNWLLTWMPGVVFTAWNPPLHSVIAPYPWRHPVYSRSHHNVKSQGLIFRAYRHGRAWRSEIRAWKKNRNPCLKLWQCFITAMSEASMNVKSVLILIIL